MASNASEKMITVKREPLNQKNFNVQFGYTVPEPKPVKEKIRNAIANISCKKLLRSAGREVYSLVPLIETLRTYEWRKWIFLDMMAGISVGMVHIPQGMGFSLLAALAPIFGLYATFWQVLFYMFLGHCKHLSIGTMAVISLMIGTVVERETLLWRSQFSSRASQIISSTTDIPDSTFSPEYLPSTNASLTNISGSDVDMGLTAEDWYRSSVANGMSLIVGMTMLGMGILKLGVITSFMPSSFISGFTTAAALHITTTQLKGLFNVKVKRYGGMFNLPRSILEILKALPRSNPPDIVISVCCISILLFVKEFINVRYKKKLRVPIPAEMIVVVLGTMLSYFVQFHERWDVKVIGFIPTGIPAPTIPNLERADTYIIEGIVTGVTSFAISISMVEILTSKHEYQYDPNKELVAYGLSYGVSSFFHCFAGAAAPPRCVVMEMTGGKTQVASFFTTVLLLFVLLLIGPVFRYLPNACLSCIIIVALIPLYKQISILPKLWRLSKPDLLIWIVTFIVSVIVDVSVSLGVGIVFAIFVLVIPSMKANGYQYGTTQYADLITPVKHHTECVKREDIVIFRYESTLHYLTIKNFKTKLFQTTIDPRVKQNSKSISKKLYAIILDCSPIGFIDFLGIETLSDLKKTFGKVNITLVLASCNPNLLEKLSIAGLDDFERGGFDIFPTVQDALYILSERLKESMQQSLTDAKDSDEGISIKSESSGTGSLDQRKNKWVNKHTDFPPNNSNSVSINDTGRSDSSLQHQAKEQDSGKSDGNVSSSKSRVWPVGNNQTNSRKVTDKALGTHKTFGSPKKTSQW